MKFDLYGEYFNRRRAVLLSVSESKSGGPVWPQELALITIKHLIREKFVLGRAMLYLSQNDRREIAAEYGKSLPRGFPGPETGESIGTILASALYSNPSLSNRPYWDDTDLVFGDWPLNFRSQVANKRLTSTWEDLGEWLKKNMDSPENNIKLWLESDLKWPQFAEKYRGKLMGRKFGI